jgi:hypothetical protein
MAGRAKLRLNKYRNVKTVVDGITFDSKAEARRYSELKLLERANEIRDLKLQPRYPLAIGDRPISIRNKHGVKRKVVYIADFEYVIEHSEYHHPAMRYEKIIEDVKGYDTPTSRLKRGIVEAQYGIRVREVR